jgi:E3 SUMO-protein ligase PIAS1
MPALGNGYGGGQRYAPYQPPPTVGSSRIFKDSPFYKIEEMLLSDIKLDPSPSHRQTTTRALTLSADDALRMRGDPELKLLLFSAMDNPLISYGQQDVAFPSQIEVKINGDEVKANFKGLKNKPGSTRPADITDYVRKSPANYRNTIQVTYALTQKKYNMYIYLVKKHSIEDLAKRIKDRQVITKQQVLREMRDKANDPDIEVGSVNLSLKDPISTLRIAIPCRSTLCSHNQCFDAESFLQLQEQAPTWNCPICNKTVSYQALAVDQYVQEILQSVSKSTDQVTIEPNGEWHHTQPGNEQTPRTNSHGNGYADSYDDDDSEDDLVDITDSRSRISAIKSEAVPTPQSLARTPPLSSREASSAPRTGNKRASEVIDLTLSDEDEPPRPAKKVAYNTPTSLPDPVHRYQQPPPTFGSSSVPMRPQAQSFNSIPAMRLDPPRNHPEAPPSYRPPPPRNSFSGYGSSTHPTYLGSSP